MFVDLIGKRFVRLIVIKRVNNDKNGNLKWLCKCDCGIEKIIRGGDLKTGKTQSCGCLHREIVTKHGLSQNDRTYKSWKCMIQRCTNPNNKRYKDYGGDEITICEEWSEFPSFLRDMGERLSGYTIERRDNSKGYFPKNCYWATRSQQQRNKQNNRYIKYRGKTQLLIEWAEKYGIPYKVLYNRIYSHDWSMGKALTTSVKKRRRK